MSYTQFLDQHSSPDIANALSELTSLLLSEDPLVTLLARVGTLDAQDLPWVQSCGVTSTVDGRSTTIVATDDLATDLDHMQYDEETGPGLEAMSTGAVVTISDCRADLRFAAFPRRAAAAGVRCVLSLPLKVGDNTFGVLNLYGGTEHEFDDDELRVGRLFAAQAARILTAITRYSDQAELSGHLQAALSSRAAIDQAIGVFMAMHRCSPAQAFDRLRNASQHRNVKLRVVAAETLAIVQLPAQASRSGG